MIDQTIERLEVIGRGRALSDDESAMLERAVRRSRRKAQRPWSPKDVLRLLKMARQRKKWVEMAAALERTPEAIGRKLRKLREEGKCGYISAPGGTGRYPRKGSKANDGRDGV